MGDWFLFVLVLSAGWTLFKLAQWEHIEMMNRRSDAWIRAKDFCPRCGADDVVVVRADTTGVLYGACKSCDLEVLL